MVKPDRPIFRPVLMQQRSRLRTEIIRSLARSDVINNAEDIQQTYRLSGKILILALQNGVIAQEEWQLHSQIANSKHEIFTLELIPGVEQKEKKQWQSNRLKAGV